MLKTLTKLWDRNTEVDSRTNSSDPTVKFAVKKIQPLELMPDKINVSSIEYNILVNKINELINK
jgi:hypothetical protein